MLLTHVVAYKCDACAIPIVAVSVRACNAPPCALVDHAIVADEEARERESKRDS